MEHLLKQVWKPCTQPFSSSPSPRYHLGMQTASTQKLEVHIRREETDAVCRQNSFWHMTEMFQTAVSTTCGLLGTTFLEDSTKDRPVRMKDILANRFCIFTCLQIKNIFCSHRVQCFHFFLSSRPFFFEGAPRKCIIHTSVRGVTTYFLLGKMSTVSWASWYYTSFHLSYWSARRVTTWIGACTSNFNKSIYVESEIAYRSGHINCSCYIPLCWFKFSKISRRKGICRGMHLSAHVYVHCRCGANRKANWNELLLHVTWTGCGKNSNIACELRKAICPIYLYVFYVFIKYW